MKGSELKGKPEKKESSVKLFSDSKTQEKVESLKNVESKLIREKKERPKCRDSKREKSKIQRVETTGIETGFESNISLVSLNNNFCSSNERMSIDLSMLNKLNDISKI